jgi:hypothetical protein
MSFSNGQSNTTLLVASDSNSGSGGVQAHNAAAACDSATTHGYSDWYLPSYNETLSIMDNSGLYTDLGSNFHWSSNQPDWDSSKAWSILNSANNWQVTKNTGQNVRCMRRE